MPLAPEDFGPVTVGNASVSLEGRPILRRIDLAVGTGEFVAPGEDHAHTAGREEQEAGPLLGTRGWAGMGLEGFAEEEEAEGESDEQSADSGCPTDDRSDEGRHGV